MNKPKPNLSIVIVNYNTAAHLQNCLRSIRECAPRGAFEVIVVDNGSSDNSVAMVRREFPLVCMVESATNDGYGVAVNRAIRLAQGEAFLLLNPDTELSPGAVDAMLQLLAQEPLAGVVGPRLLLPNSEPQPSARRFPSAVLLLVEALRVHRLLPSRVRARILLGTYCDQTATRRVPWISGACHLIPRGVWETVGPLTEETFCGFDDLDWCYRATSHGFQVWLLGSVTIRHHCSVAVRRRWSPWEVEQVAIHSSYVVLSDLWPIWRVKTYCATEAMAWMIELALASVRQALGLAGDESVPQERLLERLRLTLRLLVGLEKPRRRFQPGGLPAAKSS